MTTTTQTSRRRLGRSLWVASGVAMAATLGAGTLLAACGSGDAEISETIDPIAEANAAGNVALCDARVVTASTVGSRPTANAQTDPPSP